MREYDVNKASDNYDEIENIPKVIEIVLKGQTGNINNYKEWVYKHDNDNSGRFFVLLLVWLHGLFIIRN